MYLGAWAPHRTLRGLLPLIVEDARPKVRTIDQHVRISRTSCQWDRCAGREYETTASYDFGARALQCVRSGREAPRHPAGRRSASHQPAETHRR